MTHFVSSERPVIHELNQTTTGLISIPLMAEIITAQCTDRWLHTGLDDRMDNKPGFFYFSVFENRDQKIIIM